MTKDKKEDKLLGVVAILAITSIPMCITSLFAWRILEAIIDESLSKFSSMILIIVIWALYFMLVKYWIKKEKETT